MSIGFASGQSPTDDLHAHMVGRQYRDDKISVRAPPGWTVAVDVNDSNQTPGYVQGAVLRKGRYTLRLCTGCGQISGVAGGRFMEIKGLVQPLATNGEENWSPCGVEKVTDISRLLYRADFWYRRNPANVPDFETGGCREPLTLDTVWYGTFFGERCSGLNSNDDCRGYFLHHDWLAEKKQDSPLDEMAFGLMYETDDMNTLPHAGDAELMRVLRQASMIVASVRYVKGKIPHPE
jgi:hypothetical protein